MIQKNYELNLDDIFLEENTSKTNELNLYKINQSEEEEMNPLEEKEINIFFNQYEPIKIFLDRLEEIIENNNI